MAPSEDAISEGIEKALIGEVALSIRLLLLKLSLDVIEGQGEERCEESSNGRRHEGGAHAGSSVLAQLFLRQAEECEHSEVEGHGPDDCGSAASPQA